LKDKGRRDHTLTSPIPGPSSGVHFIGAGGGTDIVARIVAQSMSNSLGRQAIVENRPGAAARIATGLASKSSPDGYT
jgi:tripartite-type tricarboxylate transporter receptor subunit TctC